MKALFTCNWGCIIEHKGEYVLLDPTAGRYTTLIEALNAFEESLSRGEYEDRPASHHETEYHCTLEALRTYIKEVAA